MVFRQEHSTRRDGGFTYFGILIAIALIGISLAAAGSTWSIQKRRANELALLQIGNDFQRAIRSYYNATPNGVHQYPLRLTDLTADRRGNKLARHMRRIPVDPITGSKNWELVKLPDGAIIGIASSAIKEPLKQSNFAAYNAAFEGATCICDWKFVYLPQVVGNTSD